MNLKKNFTDWRTFCGSGKKKIIVAGDLNARAVEWGMQNTDSMGKRVLELTAQLPLSVINAGKVSTFRSPGYS